MELKLLFSDYFEVDADILDNYGALDICISSDLPLFIDPFLLFASDKVEYQKLHDVIVEHLIYLKKHALLNGEKSTLQIFKFPEIKQNWLGFCEHGNEGKGLGSRFAKNLIIAFNTFYSNFGAETISESSHIEKLTLMGKGIGRDFISDFTTNLILKYLLIYTENFAKIYLKSHQRKKFNVRCIFDKKLGIWKPKVFELPYFYLESKGDFILLTPLDILSKDEAFICHKDLYDSFSKITNSLENSALRDSINNYFWERIPHDAKQKERDEAITATINKFPEILDYYIKYKEKEKDEAQAESAQKINKLNNELIVSSKSLSDKILEHSDFFAIAPNSYENSLKRAHFLKKVIEENDGYKIFYHKGSPISQEDTIQRIFRLTWFCSPFDVNSEVNNGRGPADYKVSYGANDSTIIEFKLGRSSSLKRNLKKQTNIYKKASGSHSDIKVILCYTKNEIAKVKRALFDITSSTNIPENVIIIDASPKKSASTL